MSANDVEKMLEQAVLAVDQQKQAVKMYFNEGSNMDGLHCCANALRVLRTSGLSPKAYYELYIKTTEVLDLVGVYLTDEFKNGRPIPHLYELVQYVQHVVPRLYLLITVGVVYIRAGELPCRDILVDLVEMCRGVQHPLRGLFLRYYLLSSIPSNLLVECSNSSSSKVSGVEGRKDSERGERAVDEGGVGEKEVQLQVPLGVEFVLGNFGEMNKLWVRMQHQGHSREREERERQRRDLRVLVGANLHRLSQLLDPADDDDADRARVIALYRAHVLPSILTQVIQCRDVIAQEYLMDVIVQTFPDEFHVATLPQLLKACGHLQPAVRLKPIIEGLVERLLRCIPCTEGADPQPAPTDQGCELFEALSSELSELVRARASLYSVPPPAVTAEEARLGLPPDDIPGLFAPLAALALRLPSPAAVSLDRVLTAAGAALEALSTGGAVRVQPGSALSRELLGLLLIPLNVQSAASADVATLSVFSVGGGRENGAPGLGPLSLPDLLAMPGFLRLAALLDEVARRRLASLLISRALDSPSESSRRISTEAQLTPLLSLLSVLISSCDTEDDEDQLTLLAASLHLLHAPSIEGQLALLSQARKAFAASSAVVRGTFPTLVHSACRLLTLPSITPQETEKVIAFCHQATTKLVACGAADSALRLFLHLALVIESALVGEQAGLFAYECFSQAFTLLEQQHQGGGSGGNSAAEGLAMLISALWRVRRCLDAESARLLKTQCARAAQGLLLRRADQSRSMAMVTRLALEEGGGGGEGDVDAEVLSGLEKARSLAEKCMDLDARAQLFADLLNHHLIYCALGVANKPPEEVQKRLEDLLAETDRLVSQLEFVPDSLRLYVEATRAKVKQVVEGLTQG